jgi:hypothetical protein
MNLTKSIVYGKKDTHQKYDHVLIFESCEYHIVSQNEFCRYDQVKYLDLCWPDAITYSGLYKRGIVGSKPERKQWEEISRDESDDIYNGKMGYKPRDPGSFSTMRKGKIKASLRAFRKNSHTLGFMLVKLISDFWSLEL